MFCARTRHNGWRGFGCSIAATAALVLLIGCTRSEVVAGRYWFAGKEAIPDDSQLYDSPARRPIAPNHRMTGQRILARGRAYTPPPLRSVSPLTVHERAGFPEVAQAKINLQHIAQDRVTGVCFGGGGMRAAASALGQLRALHHLGLIEEIDYIAAVSGGSWTALPFTYLPGNVADERFLGRYVPPAALSVDNLLARPGQFGHAEVIGSPPSVKWRLFWNLLKLQYSESYSRALGSKLLAPWGLNGAKFLTLDGESRSRLIGLNSHLDERDFHVVEHVGRPFLIVGGCVANYSLSPWKWGETYGRRFPLELTPLYIGIPQRFNRSGKPNARLGGLYVEPLLYDSRKAVLMPGTMKAQARLSNRAVLGLFGARNSPRLSLRDLLGISGSAPGEVWLGVPLGITPVLNHWSSDRSRQTRHEVSSRPMPHTDGGLIENLGLASLLARRVDRIVVFVSNGRRLELNDGKLEGLPSYVVGYFDNNLPREMFDGERRLNKVFDHRGLKAMSDDLARQLAQPGRRAPLAHRNTYRVQDNVVHGIAPVEPYDVEVLWIFLDEGGWLGEIGDSKLCQLIAARRFRGFPYFATFDTSLGPAHAAALAHLTAWGAMQHADAIRDVLSGRQ